MFTYTFLCISIVMCLMYCIQANTKDTLFLSTVCCARKYIKLQLRTNLLHHAAEHINRVKEKRIDSVSESSFKEILSAVDSAVPIELYNNINTTIKITRDSFDSKTQLNQRTPISKQYSTTFD